ncbi:hypothetical protein SDC9_187471 [bioreactor metagenome]|uniref:Uncharacterized protein n=1 Tax=bioreactor metagenome TaxID=1076179 RepID=A0A645HLY6_9ZZZZ
MAVVELKMGMGVDKAGENQAAFGVNNLRVQGIVTNPFGIIADPPTYRLDFFSLQQYVTFTMSLGQNQYSILD